jgi:GPH family glycoside/pentoside/hexuronide:cation symporter
VIRSVAGIYFLAWLAVNLVAAMFEYYLTHAMGMGAHLERVLGCVQISALASVPLVAWASERWGRARTLAAAASGWALVMIALATLPRGAVGLGYGLAVMVGPGIAAAHVVPWTLVTEAVDADARIAGRRREGAIYGLLGLLQKGGVALVLAGAQFTLGKAGYVANGVQTDLVQWLLRALFGGVPAVLLGALAARMIWLTRAPVAKGGMR